MSTRDSVDECASGLMLWCAASQDFDAYFQSMPPHLRDVHTRGARKGQPRTPAEQRDYYNREWITWQMSDHLLLWVELRVDFTEHYLQSLKPGEQPLADPRE